MCQIKWENCFASLLMVIHTKYNGRRCGRQDLIFKTEVGCLGLETLRRSSKNFPTEVSVKSSTVHVLLDHILIR